jgi:hypothetical protein
VTAQIDPLPSSAPISYKEYVIGTMDTTRDVIASEHGQALLNAEAAFFGKYKAKASTLAPGAQSMDDFKNLLNCEITVSSEVDPAKSTNKIIRVTYTYKYNGSLGNLAGINTDVTTEYIYTEEIEAVSIPAENLDNIYLFYTPLNLNDKINFVFQQNSNGDDEVASDFGSGSKVKDVNLYIVAQNSLDDAGNVVSGIPATYNLQVTCDTAALSFGDAVTKVYTNLTATEINDAGSFVAGKVEHSLVHGDRINRLADITVTVNIGSKEYAKVTGTKIQN